MTKEELKALFLSYETYDEYIESGIDFSVLEVDEDIMNKFRQFDKERGPAFAPKEYHQDIFPTEWKRIK